MKLSVYIKEAHASLVDAAGKEILAYDLSEFGFEADAPGIAQAAIKLKDEIEKALDAEAL